MNKVILFLWFGYEQPDYIDWTLDNFRKINPNWEIRFIKYSNKQILNYFKTNDETLVRVLSKPNRKYYNHMSYLVDAYKHQYLCDHSDELIVYCDLDCFPIAPFDNFFILEENEYESYPTFIKDNYCKNESKNICLGTCAKTFPNTRKSLFKDDMWCICNKKSVMQNMFIQINKDLNTHKKIIFNKGMMINDDQIQLYEKRNMDFHNMNINLGDNFCLSQFTPIEHYYSLERNKLNKSIKN